MKKIILISFLMVLAVTQGIAQGCSNYGNAVELETVIQQNAISQTISGGTYKITHDLDLTKYIILDNLIFKDVEILVSENVNIFTKNNSKVELYGAYIHTCDARRWKGINIGLGGNITSNFGSYNVPTIIEDADIAINYLTNSSVIYYVAWRYGHIYKQIEIDNTIFNNNFVAINYYNNRSDSKDYTQFIDIQSAIITKRRNIGDIFYKQVDYKQLIVNNRAGSNSAEFDQPYLDNNLYPYDNSKPPFNPNILNGLFESGIRLNNVGQSDKGLVPSSGITYAFVKIGDDNSPYPLIIDNIQNGIFAESSNFKVENTVFQHQSNQFLQTTHIIGINAKRTDNIYGNKFNIFPMYMDVSSPKNVFFNLRTCISATNVTTANISNALMSTNGDLQYNGVNYRSAGEIRGIDFNSNFIIDARIERNKIYNVKQPINFSDNSVPTPQLKRYTGIVNINDNVLRDKAVGNSLV